MKKQKTEYIQYTVDKLNWTAIDATNKTLGRLASECAKRIMGKHLPSYTPSSNLGDSIIIYNIEKINVTGKKNVQKVYYQHSGYPGGLKETTFKDMMLKKPEYIFINAVKGMLPKGRLGRSMLKKLRVYTGNNFNHDAQKPTLIKEI